MILFIEFDALFFECTWPYRAAHNEEKLTTEQPRVFPLNFQAFFLSLCLTFNILESYKQAKRLQNRHIFAQGQRRLI